jgi:hypothetical protein
MVDRYWYKLNLPGESWLPVADSEKAMIARYRDSGLSVYADLEFMRLWWYDARSSWLGPYEEGRWGWCVEVFEF